MCTGGADLDAQLDGLRAEVDATIDDHPCGVIERLAATGLYFDLAGNQFARHETVQRASLAGVTQFLEAIRHAEGVRVENLKLLLDTDRKVGRVFEVLACRIQRSVRILDGSTHQPAYGSSRWHPGEATTALSCRTHG